MILFPGEINSVPENTVIYTQGEPVDSIAYILEGTITRERMQTIKDIDSGHFIALHSLFAGSYSATYTSKTDLSLLILEGNNPKALYDFLIDNPQLQERMFLDFSKLIVQLQDMYKKFYTQSVVLSNCINKTRKDFLLLTEETSFSVSFPDNQDFIEYYTFADLDLYDDYRMFADYIDNPSKAYTHMHLNREYIFSTQAELIIKIYTAYEKLINFTNNSANDFFGKEDSSVVRTLNDFIRFLKASGNTQKELILELIRILKFILESAKTFEFSFKKNCAHHLTVDYFAINLCLKSLKEDSPPVDQELPTGGILNFLFDYVTFSEDKRSDFIQLLEKFKQLEDKHSRGDAARKLFRNLTEIYYTLYENVFFNWIQKRDENRFVDLFLNFGLLDESLLLPEELRVIIHQGTRTDTSLPCKTYNMKDWLTLVYEGEEFSSKNEFDEDYIDFVRREAKEQGISKAEEKKMYEDKNKRVLFEIQNVLRYNNRLLSGNLLSFVPFMHSEAFETNIKNMSSSPKGVNEIIESVRKIDYSLFYREFMYADIKSRIEKEMIQKEVFPIVIFFPVAGGNGIMWQETTRKRSDSPGRFFLPAFISGNQNDILLKILGRFRWELCKQMFGVSWNNIQVPSLTSWYSDYVQFYKKNRDLSAEKKEALKNQISKCRNKTSEVFLSDYIVWIKYESTGALRLNPVARKILGTFCPFSKDLREQLGKQPVFEAAMKKYFIDKEKKIKELQNRFKALERKKAILTKELLDTEAFYNDL